MFNYNLSLKKHKQLQSKIRKQVNEDEWQKHYHKQIQPKLLEHYDARVNAFIKRVQEQGLHKRVQTTQTLKEDKLAPFKFALSQRSNTTHKTRQQTEPNLTQTESIWRASTYCPLGHHQFRQRDKSRELSARKNTKNQTILKRLRSERKAVLRQPSPMTRSRHITKSSIPYSFRHRDSYSDANSLMDDNVSMRHSVHSDNQNIQKDAREYEKKMEIVEKKNHYKRLANLETMVSDGKAKKAIYELLVQQGKRRQKIKSEREEGQTDLLKAFIEKGTKTESQ